MSGKEKSRSFDVFFEIFSDTVCHFPSPNQSHAVRQGRPSASGAHGAPSTPARERGQQKDREFREPPPRNLPPYLVRAPLLSNGPAELDRSEPLARLRAGRPGAQRAPPRELRGTGRGGGAVVSSNSSQVQKVTYLKR